MSTRLQWRPNSVDDCNGVAIAALLQNREVHGALPIDAHNVGLDLLRVFSSAHITHEHGRLPTVFIGMSLICSAVGPGYWCRGCSRWVRFRVARGQDQVAVVHGANHVHHRQFVRIQFQRIDVHHDLAIAAAKRCGTEAPCTLAIWLRTVYWPRSRN